MSTKLFLPVVLAMAALLVFHVEAVKDLPKETLLKSKPEAVEPASAPGGPHDDDDKHFIAFGGVGGVAGIGGAVGVIPIGDMGGNGLGGLPGGLGGLPGGLGTDPGKAAACGTGGGLAGAVGRKPVVPLVP